MENQANVEKIKGLLIDPEKESIEEIEITRDGRGCLRDLRAAIGCDTVDVLREIVNVNYELKQDDVWIDDEAFLKDQKHFWVLPPFMENYMAGRGVILSYNDDGDCESHTLTPDELADLRRRVRFAHLKDME